jgi:tetratricopeptide (TPR) repeat protein
MNGKLVFVSYAHEDRRFLDDELLPFLRHLELGEQIELWNDRLIGVGEDWYGEISNKLDQANLAILLVTQNFLASSFCLHEEIPVLLQRARRRELHILPLLVKPCNWMNERWLARAQMWPGSKALTEHALPRRQRLLADFAPKVLAAVNGPPTPPPILPHLNAQNPTHDLQRLPATGSLLFGRRREIQFLDQAWNDGKTNIVAFTAGGGVGKSTLARVWAEMLAEDGWRGAERAYAWSFYSQGSGRMTDSETFLNEALRWFGATTEEWQGRSIWDRAELLAERMRRHRTLLILDGVEPLQSSEFVDRGSLRDPGLRTLLEALAEGHPGLCVVTTRERLADLLEVNEPAVVHRDLNEVERLAGRALLRVKRVRGEDSELEKAVDNLGGHALAVSLAGRLLMDGGTTPHVSGLNALPALEHPVKDGGHARRVLKAWATRLGESAELELLSVVGLFDRPADLPAVRAVIDGPPIAGLNAHLRTADLGKVAERLREAHLLARGSTHADALDTHPLVREHFSTLLRVRHPKSWAEGHLRLYTHLKNTTEHQPEGLSALQPLFTAVVHGCAAGLHQEAYSEVYRARITRDDPRYLLKKLGAFAAALSCISNLFVDRWQRPHPALRSTTQNSLINNAGYLLRCVGRLREAVGPIEEALERGISREDWKNVAVCAGNLSDIHVVLGELELAEARARDAVVYADRCGDPFQRASKRNTLADVCHQLGQTTEAFALFADAERLQVEREPTYPLLYGIGGYHYCDLFLGEGNPDEALRRAAQTLDWATSQGFRLEISLDHLTLGRAHLSRSRSDLDTAEEHLQAAVDGLRSAGQTEFIPRGFLARAALHRVRDDLPRACKDLDTVRKLIRRHGLRLFEADLALEETRYHLAADDKGSATTTLAKGRELIAAMRYGRRDAELAALEDELGGKRA